MEVKELRMAVGMTQKEFAAYFGIPIHQIQHWEQGYRNPKPYVTAMMKRILCDEGALMQKDTDKGMVYVANNNYYLSFGGNSHYLCKKNKINSYYINDIADTCRKNMLAAERMEIWKTKL